jgi:TPR repeat protein
LRLIQRQALCTYRDLDLPASRFGDALELLERADLSAPQPSSETLGLADAICKYQWKLTGQRRDLERSIAYYRIGAARNVTDDEGYTAINAAFMLDILAQQERDDTPDEARHHADEADAKMPADIGGQVYALFNDRSDISPLERQIRQFVKVRI